MAKTPPGRRPKTAARDATATTAATTDGLVVRPVRRGDLDQIIAIDAAVTGLEKRGYWLSVYRRYGAAGKQPRQFLVAAIDQRVVGYVIGEVRDWEFGSPPSGWVFAINVDPRARLAGVGTRLLRTLQESFRRMDVRTMRTMLDRDNTLILSFFRSHGMTAGSLIPLQMDIDA